MSLTMRTMSTYRIKKLSMIDFNDEIHEFLHKSVVKLAALTGGDFSDAVNIDFLRIINTEHLFICFRNDKPVGFLYASEYSSIFTRKVRILMQHSLYSEPRTRAAKLLLDHFLDFGKSRVDHVITMITPYTNIKPCSLEKMGFKELETLYRWKHGQ